MSCDFQKKKKKMQTINQFKIDMPGLDSLSQYHISNRSSSFIRELRDICCCPFLIQHTGFTAALSPPPNVA